jgi:toxin ParE1/3/4
MRRVIISEPATQELLEQLAYIRKQNPSAARRQRERVSRAVGFLRGSPGLGGRLGRVEGTRELVVTGTPFVLIFEVSGNRIDILHIVHGRQNWPPEPRETDDGDLEPTN